MKFARFTEVSSCYGRWINNFNLSLNFAYIVLQTWAFKMPRPLFLPSDYLMIVKI